LVGPIVSVVSFVCSIGNVPLAAVLWNNGISFGGVISFIFADLIILPILSIKRRYYGTWMTVFLFATFYAAMAIAGLLVELLFGALGTYQSIERQNPGIFNVLVMGPWFHGGWARSDGDWLGTAYFGMKTGVYYREHFELPFFNHFLKDKGDISQIKEVNVFDTGANEWRDVPNWSPTVSTSTSRAAISTSRWRSRARSISARPRAASTSVTLDPACCNKIDIDI